MSSHERAEVAHRNKRDAQKQGATRSIFMLDVFMLALGLGFFVAAVSYAYACERL
jgi:hypothetical protein